MMDHVDCKCCGWSGPFCDLKWVMQPAKTGPGQYGTKEVFTCPDCYGDREYGSELFKWRKCGNSFKATRADVEVRKPVMPHKVWRRGCPRDMRRGFSVGQTTGDEVNNGEMDEAALVEVATAATAQEEKRERWLQMRRDRRARKWKRMQVRDAEKKS